jgi:hypothetical protein
MDKIVHAILIDSPARAIRVVRVDPSRALQSAYDLLNCEVIEAATRLPNGDVVYVDEEGVIKPKGLGHFKFQGREFHGMGLIVNEANDDWTAPHSPVVELFRSIEFSPGPAEPPFGAAEIIAAMLDSRFRLMTENDYEPFAGAQPRSAIAYDLEGWTVIVGPGNAGDLDREALSVHAYKYPSPTEKDDEELAYELTVGGWNSL